MLKLHGRAAALAIGGVLAIGLPAGFVLAGTSHDAHGSTVSAAARSSSSTGEAHGDAVSTLARGSHGTSPGGEATPDGQAGSNAGADTHGDAVSVVAQDSSKVGGKNDNHGGAVSAVARTNAGSGGSQPATGHGAKVSTVARSTTTTGEAHGDAVAAAARSH